MLFKVGNVQRDDKPVELVHLMQFVLIMCIFLKKPKIGKCISEI